jgi:hypothetical protein
MVVGGTLPETTWLGARLPDGGLLGRTLPELILLGAILLGTAGAGGKDGLIAFAWAGGALVTAVLVLALAGGCTT